MNLYGVISTVHAFVEIGDSLLCHDSQRDCDLAVMHGCGSKNSTYWHTGVNRIDMELVSDPGIPEALCIDFRASVTVLSQFIKHLLQRHVIGSLALKLCFFFRGSLFTLPRASPLAFYRFLIALTLRYRFLTRRDRSGVTADMSNNTIPYKFLDQCLMYPPWKIALGKFSKSP